MDQTDFSLMLGFPAGVAAATAMVKLFGWPWYLGVPVGFVGGVLIVAAPVYFLIGLLPAEKADETPENHDQ